MSGFCCFRYRAVPVIVPHVPAPATKWVMRPPVCRHNSGPVVFSCARGLLGLAYWLGRNALRSLGDALGDLVVALRILRRHGNRAHDHLGPVGPQQRDLLRPVLVGHHEHALVPALRRDDGKADAGVATGRLDDGAARLQQAITFCGEDHLQRRSVLRRPTRIGGLHLHRQHALDPVDLARALQANQRRVADEVEHAVGDRGAVQPDVRGIVTPRHARHGTGRPCDFDQQTLCAHAAFLRGGPVVMTCPSGKVMVNVRSAVNRRSQPSWWTRW